MLAGSVRLDVPGPSTTPEAGGSSAVPLEFCNFYDGRPSYSEEKVASTSRQAMTVGGFSEELSAWLFTGLAFIPSEIRDSSNDAEDFEVEDSITGDSVNPDKSGVGSAIPLAKLSGDAITLMADMENVLGDMSGSSSHLSSDGSSADQDASHSGGVTKLGTYFIQYFCCRFNPKNSEPPI